MLFVSYKSTTEKQTTYTFMTFVPMDNAEQLISLMCTSMDHVRKLEKLEGTHTETPQRETPGNRTCNPPAYTATP